MDPTSFRICTFEKGVMKFFPLGKIDQMHAQLPRTRSRSGDDLLSTELSSTSLPSTASCSSADGRRTSYSLPRSSRNPFDVRCTAAVENRKTVDRRLTAAKTSSARIRVKCAQNIALLICDNDLTTSTQNAGIEVYTACMQLTIRVLEEGLDRQGRAIETHLEALYVKV